VLGRFGGRVPAQFSQPALSRVNDDPTFFVELKLSCNHAPPCPIPDPRMACGPLPS
jgi:hypothetical protein